jgi:hypothetical protein
MLETLCLIVDYFSDPSWGLRLRWQKITRPSTGIMGGIANDDWNFANVTSLFNRCVSSRVALSGLKWLFPLHHASLISSRKKFAVKVTSMWTVPTIPAWFSIGNQEALPNWCWNLAETVFVQVASKHRKRWLRRRRHGVSQQPGRARTFPCPFHNFVPTAPMPVAAAFFFPAKKS